MPIVFPREIGVIPPFYIIGATVRVSLLSDGTTNKIFLFNGFVNHSYNKAVY